MILEEIKKTMKANGIKAVRLCKDLEMQESYFSQFINGKKDVGYKTVEKILIYLDLEVKKRSNYIFKL